MMTTNPQTEARAIAPWHLGSMNDGLFIIDTPPRPSTDDAWHVRPDGPTVVLNVTDLPRDKAEAIVDAHNAALAAKDAELAMARRNFEELAELQKASFRRAERAEAQLAEAIKALEPFATVAEHDIGDDETDDDIFWPISNARYSMSGRLRVGHLRAARRTALKDQRK